MQSVDSDQTTQMCRLIRVFAGRTSLIVGLLCAGSVKLFKEWSMFLILYSNCFTAPDKVLFFHLIFVPVHYKTNKMARVPREDANQPGHLRICPV